MSATRFLRKIAHPTVRQPRFVFDALHVAEFHFYFRLAWLGRVSRVFLLIVVDSLLSTLRGTRVVSN